MASSSASSSGAECPVDHKNMTIEDWKKISPDHPFYSHAQKMVSRLENTNPNTSAPSPVAPAAKTEEKINPLNMMPELSQNPHADQKVALPTERSFSTIPKSAATDMDEKAYGAKDDKVWVYPSPQQFYVGILVPESS
jgi:cytochrome c heme-lyase